MLTRGSMEYSDPYPQENNGKKPAIYPRPIALELFE